MIDFPALLRATSQADPNDVADLMVSAASQAGGVDVVVYLVDFDQQFLEPLPDRTSHDELPHSEEVTATLAGRAFLQQRAIVAEREGGNRVWVPIMEGSDPTGVLALTVSAIDEASLATCEALGILAGYLIATHDRVTDLYGLRRRRRAMSLPASMQWDLLPPLTLTAPGVAAAGMLEPAYEVGGDCFDYALNGSTLDLAVMDAMGHGVASAMISALAAGCYRHGRRSGRALEQIHRDLHEVIVAQEGEAFVTGIIGRLDLNTGTFSSITAGHPPPLLVRRGHVISPMEAAERQLPPWGVDAREAEGNLINLEPGDTLLFYTDGVTDARGSRHPDFGLDRLVDLVNQRASEQLPVGLMVRLITRAVLEHHQGRLHDDATVLMIHWESRHS